MADKTNEQTEQLEEQEQGLVYFVSFYHSRGFDNAEVSMIGEIFHIEQITEMQQMIEADLGYKDVRVQAFFPLRTDEGVTE